MWAYSVVSIRFCGGETMLGDADPYEEDQRRCTTTKTSRIWSEIRSFLRCFCGRIAFYDLMC
jgi:hypothetical protein